MVTRRTWRELSYVIFNLNLLLIKNPCALYVSADPVVVPLGLDEDKHSEPDKDEDVGITFVARKTPETPKERPKSGEE